MNVRRRKPVTIESVILTTEQRQQLKESVDLKLVAHSRNTLIRKLLGGCCLGCFGVPTKKVVFTLKEAKLVEFYCDNCFNLNNLGK